MKRLILGAACAALLFAVTAGASGDGTLTITPTVGNATALTINNSPGGRTLTANNFRGDTGLQIAGDGEILGYDIDTGTPRISVQAAANPQNVIEVRDSGTNRLVAGVANGGALITAQNVAPNPAYMANGEARVWFDPTPVTGGLMVTEKDSAGTVKTVKLG